MEASDCVHGGYYRAGTPQEKKAGAGGDHFIIEDLLDFSNEKEEEEEEDNGASGGDDGGLEATAGNSTEDSSTVTNSSLSGGHLTGRSITEASLSGDLCEPYDDLAELEWLSNFVEDSFSSEDLQKLQLISGVKSGSGSYSDGSSSSETREIPSSPGKIITQQQTPFFLPEASVVPGKARSKRSRGAPGNWSSRLLILCPNTATSSPEAESILLNPHPNPHPFKKAPKQRKKEGGLVRPALVAPSDGRKCLHCATDKTPQWRTGPMGPKTLCNACGVRYKSGRLVPEYRPAASPTFVLSKHSNSHRKVMELRRQKEIQEHHGQFMHSGPMGFDPAVMGSASESSGDEFLIHHHLDRSSGSSFDSFLRGEF